MTSSSEEATAFQKELSCSICLDFLTKPVSIECGHSFCHGCFLGIWHGPSTPFSCPECRHVSQMNYFEVNMQLGKLAVIVKKRRRGDFQDPEEQVECEVHRKVQKLFCEDDQSPVCVSCSLSQEHEAHQLSVIDEAANNFREKLQEAITAMWSKNEYINRKRGQESINFLFLEKEIEIQKKYIVSEFQKIKEFLSEEKDARLSHLEAQRTAKVETLNQRINRLYNQNQELGKRITDLEELCKKSDQDLLQNMKEVLNKNESVVQKRRESSPPRICVLSNLPMMMAQIFSFKVDITMDRNTVTPGLIISEDLKSMRYGGVQEEALHNNETVHMASVLGTQSFISGRYYWEVEVPDNTIWCVGIRELLQSQIFFALCSTKKNNLFAISKKDIFSPLNRLFRQRSVPDLKVGIFLDYDIGEISFYHVKARYVIYTFPTTSFSEALVPFFAVSKNELGNDGSIRICP